MPADEKSYRLDISSMSGQGKPSPEAAGGPKRDLAGVAPDGQAADGQSMAGRPYLSVQFACCGVYTRIYRSADGKSYRGRCPRCGLPVNFVVGAGGTDARVFVVE